MQAKSADSGCFWRDRESEEGGDGAVRTNWRGKLRQAFWVSDIKFSLRTHVIPVSASRPCCSSCRVTKCFGVRVKQRLHMQYVRVLSWYTAPDFIVRYRRAQCDMTVPTPTLWCYAMVGYAMYLPTSGVYMCAPLCLSLGLSVYLDRSMGGWLSAFRGSALTQMSFLAVPLSYSGTPHRKRTVQNRRAGKGAGLLFCSVEIWRRASAHKLLTKATIGAVYDIEYMKSSA